MDKKKKKINLALKFMIVMLSITVIYGGFFLGGVYWYIKANPQPVYDPSKQSMSVVTEEYVKQRTEDVIAEKGVLANVVTPPVRTNFLIVGVDKGQGLTDSIMVGSYLSTTGEMKLMSVPRDTYVEFSGENLKTLREISSGAPSVMKINAVNAHGGKKQGMPLLRSTIEDMLDIRIDYYALVDLQAFKDIVDSVGGIDFDVPEGGLHYSDPTQGLYINLRGGHQHLNGEQAEGLVRFRKGYARQDLQRVEIQQEFMKQFVKQALSKENIKNNLYTMISSYIKYVNTDFTLDDLPQYIKCIQTLNADNIESTTLPGHAEMIGSASYYIHDPLETDKVVEDFFYNKPEKTEESEETSVVTSEAASVSEKTENQSEK